MPGKRLLRFSLETKDAAIPGVVQRLPHDANFGEYRLARERSRERSLPAHCCNLSTALQEEIESKVHALGRNDACRIDTLPAGIGQPHFAPGMRVRLPHEIKAAHLIELASEIAHYHACRHSPQPHQGREAGSVMFAKTESAPKQKFVEVVSFVLARRKRITKPLRLKKI